MSDETKIDPKMRTPRFKTSFCNLMEPKAFSADQDKKYSVVLALPTDHPFWGKLEDKMKALAKKKWPDTSYKKIKNFIKEIDEDDPEAKYGWGNCKIITLSNKKPVGILVKTDEGLVDPVSDSEIYSGMIGIASFNVGCYEFNKSKGITFYLNNFLKVEDGERISGRISAEDDFADYVDGEEDNWGDD